MTDQTLHINQIHVTCEPEMLICYGLGSCIGLFISDRVSGLSGGAHIPMPSSVSKGGSLKGAQELIDNLLSSFQAKGSDLTVLRAKLTGGSSIYSISDSIGEKNVSSITDQLVSRKIFIAATDTGGSISRTARYNTKTGELRISTSENKTYQI